MTKRELINKLEAHPADDDTEVLKTYQFGDHVRTTAAIAPDEPELLVIRPWGYGGSEHFSVQEDELGDPYECLDDMREDEGEECSDDPARLVICL